MDTDFEPYKPSIREKPKMDALTLLGETALDGAKLTYNQIAKFFTFSLEKAKALIGENRLKDYQEGFVGAVIGFLRFFEKMSFFEKKTEPTDDAIQKTNEDLRSLQSKVDQRESPPQPALAPNFIEAIAGTESRGYADEDQAGGPGIRHRLVQFHAIASPGIQKTMAQENILLKAPNQSVILPSTLKELLNKAHTADLLFKDGFPKSYTEYLKHLAERHIDPRWIAHSALGKFQIIPVFHFNRLGWDPQNPETVYQFLRDPDRQRQLMEKITEDFGKKFNWDYSAMMVAFYANESTAKEYLKNPSGSAFDRLQPLGYSSIGTYVQETLQRMQALRHTEQKGPLQATPILSHTRLKSQPFERDQRTGTTLCSGTALKNLRQLGFTHVFRARDALANPTSRFEGIPQGNANEIRDYYIKFRSKDLIMGKKGASDNGALKPELNSSGKSIADIVVETSGDYGHRAVAFKSTVDGEWYLLDPYRNNGSSNPIPLEKYNGKIMFAVPLQPNSTHSIPYPRTGPLIS